MELHTYQWENVNCEGPKEFRSNLKPTYEIILGELKNLI